MQRWNKPSLSLGTWIYLALLATVVAAALPLLWIVHSHVKAHAEQQAGDALRQLAWEMRDALDRGMERHVEEMSVLASLQRKTLLHDPAAARLALDEVQRSFPDFAWIGYADTEGQVLAATQGLLEGLNVAKRPWFIGGRDGMFVGDIHPAVLLEKLLPPQAEPRRFVDVALPIRDDSGRLRGVLGMHLSWSWAQNLHRSLIDPTQHDRGAQLLVLREDGTVILGPAATEGSKLDLGVYGRVAAGGTALAVQQHETGQNYRETEYSALARTQGRGRYPGLGWAVLVRQPGVVAMASYDTLSRKVAAAGFAVAVAVLLGGLVLTHRLSQPLRKLLDVVETRTRDGRSVVHPADGSAGAGTAVAPGAAPLPPVRGYVEVNQLSDALVAMVAEEDRLTRELLAINTTLEERVLEKTAELQALARVDTLTRLPNRYSFNEKLPQALARARRQGNIVALMFLDVDHFKAINDNFGHAVGDAVLVEFAQRLSSSVRITDTVARLAGDEFVIVLEGLRGEDEAQLVAHKIVAGLQRPFDLSGRAIQVSSSIGIAVHSEGVIEPAQLLARADSALYQAKAAGRNTFRTQMA